MLKSRTAILNAQLRSNTIERYQSIAFESVDKHQKLRDSIQVSKSMSRKSFIPLYGVKSAISNPQHKVEEVGIQPNGFQIFCGFFSAIMVAFSAMYVSDSIAAQSDVLKKRLE